MSKNNVWSEDELTCKPIDSIMELTEFLQDPPPWRSLCVELKPHSEFAIKNTSFAPNQEITLENPVTFCHYTPETENVQLERQSRKKIPKALVCHDMANGYHDDSYVDGTSAYDAYTIYNWAGMDVFCYFSHHLLTVPPLGWINVAHAHGVQVIGTLITEWGPGVTFWQQILANEDEWKELANGMVAVAKTLKFDGWLLNIENKVSQPQELLKFVQYLHTSLHKELPHALLIWYDSVTIAGDLAWQNALNAKNKPFFDVCDGIFTNYSWSELEIEQSAALAGERLTDVYIGIDVWGRQFYGGGQFNTQKAVQLVYQYGCSLAIFAPAWTHEAIPDPPSDLEAVSGLKPDKYDIFLLRDRALWCSLWPYLYTKLPSTLPFQTSFCRGQGKKRRLYGEVISPSSWFNVRHMQYQTNSNQGPHGYLLTTIENILEVTKAASHKEDAGTKSFRDTRMTIATALDKTTINTTSVEEAGTSSEVHNEITDSEGTQRKKIGDVLKNMVKLFRKDDSGPSVIVDSRSVVDLNVNLKLGEVKDKTRYALVRIPGELECLAPHLLDSFIGGSCLLINPSDITCDLRIVRLLHCDFQIDNILVACVVTKKLLGQEEQYLNMKLNFTNLDGVEKTVELVGRDIEAPVNVEATSDIAVVYPVNVSIERFRELQKYLLLNEPACYVPVDNAYGWEVRYFTVFLKGCRVTSVDLRTGLPKGGILLGQVTFCRMPLFY